MQPSSLACALPCAARSLVVALAAFAGCGCGPRSSADEAVPQTAVAARSLTVYAAMSTRDALQALAQPFEREHACALVFQFGASGDLARQIKAATKADVFLSAGEREMDDLAAANLLVPDSRCDLLSNQLVVVEPNDAPTIFTAPFAPRQIADARVKRLSLAHVETVPAGRYAKAWLEQSDLWTALEARVLPALDVRAALAAVESGAAEVGIVYRTDVALARGVRIVHAVPISEGPAIRYPMALIAGRSNTHSARQLAAYLQSAPARLVFEHYGFLDAAASTARK
ncbi:MAG: molybdate ABC transporter substrate-binding protein [Planctomycetes bacterium]|nr:molybdate ABC transporter substrate-binding protein [Planctomycetota bacterium]